jgi:hypothetical protein
MHWQEWLTAMNGFLRKRAALVLIALFFVLEAVSIAVSVPGPAPAGPEDLLIRRGASPEDRSVQAPAPIRIPRLSEMRGPHIDDEAAMVVVEDEAPAAALSVSVLPGCETLPAELWVFLLIAYVALIVFNLSYRFMLPALPADQQRIQWFWEALYTLVFIGMWYAWDGCRSAAWFPVEILKTGVFLYAAYLYFFDRRMRK